MAGQEAAMLWWQAGCSHKLGLGLEHLANASPCSASWGVWGLENTEFKTETSNLCAELSMAHMPCSARHGKALAESFRQPGLPDQAWQHSAQAATTYLNLFTASGLSRSPEA